MYIPKHYKGSEGKAAIAFMERFNFGSIITSVDNVPMATHLPFVISEDCDQIIITSHFAEANSHWKHVGSNENLVIFTEPHAYVSPTIYEKKTNVPTWNYMSIHAYGKAKIIDDESTVFKTLELMMDNFEPAYRQQWDVLPEDYKIGMAKGIAVFEIIVDKLESNEKLSQNKTETESKNIICYLSTSPDTNANMIAKYMEEKGKH